MLHCGTENRRSPVLFPVYVLFSFSQNFSSKNFPQLYKIESSHLVYRITTKSCIRGLRTNFDVFVLPYINLFFSACNQYCNFYAPPQKVAGYYVIPSDILSVCPSVCLSVRPSAVHHSCPLHNFVTVGDNFTKLGTNIKHDQTTCRDKQRSVHLHFCRIIPLCNFQTRNRVRSITLIRFKIILQNLVEK